QRRLPRGRPPRGRPRPVRRGLAHALGVPPLVRPGRPRPRVRRLMGGQSAPPERTLDEADLPDDPLTLFAGWLGEAMEVERPEPTAMALATAGYDGSPSARMVLMRGFDERGI